MRDTLQLAPKLDSGVPTEPQGHLRVVSRGGLKISTRRRQHSVPAPVEATVYLWRPDERRGAGSSNQFGIMPAMPIRFRCIGALTSKSPQRYRVDLAQALDRLPDLSRNELKELGVCLALLISKKLGVKVSPVAVDVIELDHAAATTSHIPVNP